jgi:hypothetical protein
VFQTNASFEVPWPLTCSAEGINFWVEELKYIPLFPADRHTA